MQDAHFILMFVTANMTDCLQPNDQEVNRSLKVHQRMAYVNWYSEQVVRELDAGTPLHNIEVEHTSK